MHVFFDKKKAEEIQPADTDNTVGSEQSHVDVTDGKIIEKIIRDSLASGKIGSLTVDPNYLDFEALECECAFRTTLRNMQ
jgi:citrate lyase gamma subunit